MTIELEPIRHTLHGTNGSQRDSLRRYVHLLEQFSVLALELTGIHVNVGGPNWAFEKLPLESQLRVQKDLLRTIEATKEVLHEGMDLLDDRRFLWRNLVKLDWHPCSDLFDKIDGERDMVEIYDARSMIQIYRSFRFFSVCSYSLDHILCRPWFELFKRPAEVEVSVARTVKALFELKENKTLSYDIPPHVVEETDSPCLYRWYGENRFLSPLFDSHGRLVGGVNVVRAHERLPVGATALI